MKTVLTRKVNISIRSKIMLKKDYKGKIIKKNDLLKLLNVLSSLYCFWEYGENAKYHLRP